MARISLISPSHFTIFFLLSISTSNFVTLDANFAKTMNKNQLGLMKQKLTHFRLYFHETRSGKNPTAVSIIMPPKNSSTSFGMMTMIDDPLTLGPKLSSKIVGKAQGFYSSASQEGFGLLMAMNFVFMEGKYNGSTITILGRNGEFGVREMPVVGGSGLFRFARGYVQATTVSVGDSYVVVKYDCYVMHY